MTLTHLCQTTCLIYLKDESQSTSRKSKSKHEVFARYERVSLGPDRRRQAQLSGARTSDVLFVGVALLGSWHMGNCYQVRPGRATSSEGAVEIGSSSVAFLAHTGAQYYSGARFACWRAADASPGPV